MIDYLLSFETACLEPHKKYPKRATASQHQVREKVYKNSSKVWEKYASYWGRYTKTIYCVLDKNMTEHTITEVLKMAVQAHKSGDVETADKYYTAILKAQPNHSDANHNMGVLAIGVGCLMATLTLLK